MKKIAFLTAVFAVSMVFLSGCLEYDEKETTGVAAIVNGQEITSEEVKNMQEEGLSEEEALEYLIDH